MDENIIKTQDTISEDDFAIGLPDGWGPNDDIFADPSTWSGSADAPAAADESQGEAEAEVDAPTTEQAAEAEGESGAEADELPTTQGEAEGPKKLKFKATVDHEVQDVEIDEDELPTLFQKAQATDRSQKRLEESKASLSKMEKLAKVLEYEGADDFYKGTVDNLVEQRKNELISEGVHAAVAERMAKEDYAELISFVPTSAPTARDYKAESTELLQAYPELGKPGNTVPNEVILESTKPGGPRLKDAYESYLNKQKSAKDKAELDALKKENKTLKHNAEAASRAPVRSVTRTGTPDATAEDPFLKGLLSSDLW